MTAQPDDFAAAIMAAERAAATLIAAKREGSVDRAKAAAEEGRHCPQIVIEAADLIGRLGERAAALDMLSAGLSLDGPTAPLQHAYARHCRDAGDLEGARRWLRGAMLRARPNAAMAFALCEIELSRGDEPAATEAFELAGELRWIDAAALRYAADRLIAIGRGDLAAAPLMMMHLRSTADLPLRRELGALLRRHAPFERMPERQRTRLKLADPQTAADMGPPEAVGAENGIDFTTSWFAAGAKAVWDQLLPEINPTRILEIGSYEGASACYLIDRLGRDKSLEIHCVDSWEGGVEHGEGGSAQANMADVESRFRRNVAAAIAASPHPVDLIVRKGRSDLEMAKLLAEGAAGTFDFVYIDGSHQAPDVLCDAVLGFRLLRANGVIAFDDYLWQESLPYGVDPLRCPKPAIDAFTNLYARKIQIISAPLYQLYVRKLSD